MKGMRILMLGIAAFFLVISILGSAILAWRDFRDAGAVGDAYAQAQKELKIAGLNDAQSKKALDDQLSAIGAKNLPGEKDLRTGGMFAVLTLVFALSVLILMFVTQRGVLFKVAGALVVLSIVMILMNPQYETGLAGAASARNVAIVVGLLTIIGALLAIFAGRMRRSIDVATV
ncbi:MAG: hypothetical protein ABJA66_11590 [Actinomycetota bacterium]